uniref:Uncharacterized protein n=1 Tax=Opuntia streptacantha TaxID=393608 RepID=A0A7C8Z554_OPUST
MASKARESLSGPSFLSPFLPLAFIHLQQETAATIQCNVTPFCIYQFQPLSPFVTSAILFLPNTSHLTHYLLPTCAHEELTTQTVKYFQILEFCFHFQEL